MILLPYKTNLESVVKRSKTIPITALTNSKKFLSRNCMNQKFKSFHRTHLTKWINWDLNSESSSKCKWSTASLKSWMKLIYCILWRKSASSCCCRTKMALTSMHLSLNSTNWSVWRHYRLNYKIFTKKGLQYFKVG